MTKKLHILMAAAYFGLMLIPGITLAADDGAAASGDNGQYSDEASPQADQPDNAGDNGGDEGAMPEDNTGDETAPADEPPADDEAPDGPPAE